MRITPTVLAKCFALTIFVLSSVYAMSPMSPIHPDKSDAIWLNGRMNCPSFPSSGGTGYLLVTLGSRGDEGVCIRRPMNLTCVLDRSGSMGEEEKIEHAKAAVCAIIDQMRENDIFSLVIYDDEIEVPVPAQYVRSRQQLKSLVAEVYPRGWTNLGGGMQEGFRQASRHACENYVNRVVLLSDGLANRGITNPHELDRIARSYRQRSISLSTIGVGLDYNENLMVSLSSDGGGNYYFLESSRDLASVLHREFEQMSTVLVQNALLRLDLTQGVRVLDVIGYGITREGSKCDVAIGDIYAGDRREITIELFIPPGAGTRQVASGKLISESGSPLLRNTWFAAAVTYCGDVALIEERRDKDVQAKVDVSLSTRSVSHALEALDRGDKAEAARNLQEAKSALSVSPAASAGGAAAMEIKAQQERLDEYSRVMSSPSTDARKAKKEIQYNNYKTQRQKE